MRFKPTENIENWFFRKKEKDFPKRKDYVTLYKHIKSVIKTKVQKSIMVGSAIAESKKIDKKTLTGHDVDHFDEVINTLTQLLNTGNKDELSAYEVFFLLVAVQAHDIGNILDRDNHENTLFEVFNDLFLNDNSIDSVEKNIYLNIASAHAGEISGNRDKIRALMPNSIEHHNGAEIKVRYLAALLRFSDELADNPERALSYIFKKGIGEKSSEVYHTYANALTSTKVDHTQSSILINYSFTKSQANVKYQKGTGKQYLLDEIFDRIIKIHHEKLYCQKFFSNFIVIDHVNINISIFSDDHNSILKTIKLRLIEQGYPEYKKVRIENICEEPAITLMADNHKYWCGKVLKEIINKP